MRVPRPHSCRWHRWSWPCHETTGGLSQAPPASDSGPGSRSWNKVRSKVTSCCFSQEAASEIMLVARFFHGKCTPEVTYELTDSSGANSPEVAKELTDSSGANSPEVAKELIYSSGANSPEVTKELTDNYGANSAESYL